MIDQVSGQCHDNVVDYVAATKRIDTAFENRSPPQRQELLWLRGTEAKTTAAGRDKGRNVQASLILVVQRAALPLAAVD